MEIMRYYRYPDFESPLASLNFGFKVLSARNVMQLQGVCGN